MQWCDEGGRNSLYIRHTTINRGERCQFDRWYDAPITLDSVEQPLADDNNQPADLSDILEQIDFDAKPLSMGRRQAKVTST